jgi:hypothetical protein
VLVLVEHREGQGGALAGLGAAASGLAARRLDLDDKGAGLGQQQAGIGALKDLPKSMTVTFESGLFIRLSTIAFSRPTASEISIAERPRASHANLGLARRTCQ